MPEQQPSEQSLLDLLSQVDGMKPQEALRGMGGQQAFYLKLVNSFKQEQQQTSQELIQLFQTEQWDVLRRRAHSLKSYCAYIGAYALSQKAAELEGQLSDGNAADEGTVAEVSRDLAILVSSLGTVLPSENQTTDTAEFSPQTLKEQLQSLLPLVEQSDFEAEEKLHSLLAFTQGSDYHASIEQIFANVDDVEYELAAEQVRSLLKTLEQGD